MSESTVTTNIPRIRKPFGVEVPPRVPYLESSDDCGDNGHAIYIKNRKFVQSTKLINDVQWEQLFNLSGSQQIANITIEGNTIPVYAPLGGGGGGGTTTAIKVPVLTPLWFDRKVNDAGWITPGTGSATKFTSAAAGNSNTKIFEHLIDDLGGSGITTETDTYTRTTGSVIKVTYYVAKTSGGIQDGHKIIHIGTSSACSIEVTESGTTTTYAANNADNLNNILKYLKELYDDVSIGTSWYYVVSGTKANGGYFYLPRTRYGFHGTAGYAKLQRNTNKPTENEMFLYFYTGYDDDAIIDVQGERFIDVTNSSNNDRIKVVKLKNTLAASTVYPVVGANGSNQITPPALDGTYGLYITDSRSLSIKQASPNQFGVVKVPASAAFLGSDANGQLVAADPPSNKLSILDIYPVGSVYISVYGQFDPNVSFGGTWERFGSGRCLWGAKLDNSDLGETIEAGLPEVPSHKHNVPLSESDAGAGSVGEPCTAKHGSSIYTDGYANCRHVCSTGAAGNLKTGIYGKSSTVQPPACVVIFWKRTN